MQDAQNQWAGSGVSTEGESHHCHPRFFPVHRLLLLQPGRVVQPYRNQADMCHDQGKQRCLEVQHIPLSLCCWLQLLLVRPHVRCGRFSYSLATNSCFSPFFTCLHCLTTCHILALLRKSHSSLCRCRGWVQPRDDQALLTRMFIQEEVLNMDFGGNNHRWARNLFLLLCSHNSQNSVFALKEKNFPYTCGCTHFSGV